MIQEFCFFWNGRRWNGYFNALARETVIAHFEDALICDTIGYSLKYSKTRDGALSFPVDSAVQQAHTGIYDAILKGVEYRLGKPLDLYLN
jgi:hypothetical protein